MSGLPLFQPPPTIHRRFSPDARIVLFEGDVNDFLREIPDQTVNLVITSPPYNLGKDYENRVAIERYLESQAQIIAQLYRVLNNNGSLCWQVGNFVEDGEVYPLDILCYRLFKELSMRLRNRIIWRFGHGLHACKRFSGRYETLLWFTKGDDYVFDLDSVRVPAKGVGSSLIAAVMHDRRVLGSEKEPHYAELARERLAAWFGGSLRRRPIGTPIYEPTGNERAARIPDQWEKTDRIPGLVA